MQILMKQNQSSFITSQNISYNIIISYEAIHTMKSTKSKKSWMAVKVDLEKAYDRLQWEFLLDTLVDVGFSRLFCETHNELCKIDIHATSMEWFFH